MKKKRLFSKPFLFLLYLFFHKNATGLYSENTPHLKPYSNKKEPAERAISSLSSGSRDVGAFFGIDDDEIAGFHEKRRRHLQPGFARDLLVAAGRRVALHA